MPERICDFSLPTSALTMVVIRLEKSTAIASRQFSVAISLSMSLDIGGRQAPDGESNVNKNAARRTGEHVTAIEVNLRMAAEVMKRCRERMYSHIQLLYPNSYGRALTFIFSPFFSLTPFRFDLSGFLSSNADWLTANSTS